LCALEDNMNPFFMWIRRNVTGSLGLWHELTSITK